MTPRNFSDNTDKHSERLQDVWQVVSHHEHPDQALRAPTSRGPALLWEPGTESLSNSREHTVDVLPSLTDTSVLGNANRSFGDNSSLPPVLPSDAQCLQTVKVGTLLRERIPELYAVKNLLSFS